METKFSAYGGTRFCEALTKSGVTSDVILLLSEPRSVLRFSIPLRRDNGALEMFTAWRLRYSDALGPTKGGVRFYPGTCEKDLTALAFRLLLKCAVNGLPHGGAAGGVDVDPRNLSTGEKERLARSYVEVLGDRIGPDKDILSPDLGTDARTMGWMADEVRRTRGVSLSGAINGKPLVLGGIPGRPGATGRGAWSVLSALLSERGIKPEGLTFAVQGYGSAGGHLARALQQNGLRLIAASDSSGGLYSPAGIDAELLWDAKEKGRAFEQVRDAGTFMASPADVLTVKADIVIPAATANQITAELAAKLQCRMVLEIANGPIASDAETLIAAMGIEIIPDVVANAGGITMSHFEWAQNRGGALWTAEEAGSRLDQRMTSTAMNMLGTARKQNVSLTIAAQLLALQRLSAALVL